VVKVDWGSPRGEGGYFNGRMGMARGNKVGGWDFQDLCNRTFFEQQVDYSKATAGKG